MGLFLKLIWVICGGFVKIIASDFFFGESAFFFDLKNKQTKIERQVRQDRSIDISLAPIELAADNRHPGIKANAKYPKENENQTCSHIISEDL